IRMSLGQPLSKWRCQHGRMNRNESLRKTARVKRSNERIGPEATQRADLEGFAAASGKMFSDLGGAPPCMARFRSHCAKPLRTRIPTAGPVVISFEQALRIKSAEFWLRLGEPLEALADLQDLPETVLRKALVHQLHAAASRAVREYEGKH